MDSKRKKKEKLRIENHVQIKIKWFSIINPLRHQKAKSNSRIQGRLFKRVFIRRWITTGWFIKKSDTITDDDVGNSDYKLESQENKGKKKTKKESNIGIPNILREFW